MNRYYEQRAREHRPRWRFDGEGVADWRAWRDALQAEVSHSLGPMPPRVPAEAEVEQEWREGGLIKQRVVINVERGLAVPMYLFRPEGTTTPLPLILCCHGHDKFYKESVMGMPPPEGATDTAAMNQNYGLKMAEAGFVTLALDWRGFGERDDRRPPYNWRGDRGRDVCNLHYLRSSILGESILAGNVHDAMRALDYACEQPFVDADRIGVMGLSLGGTMTAWISLIDERVRAADIICYSNVFADFAIRDNNFCGSQMVHGLYQLCDVPDLHGLIAPRPLLVEIGTRDHGFAVESAMACFKEVERIYTAAGCRDRLELDLFDGGHIWGGNKSIPFFRRALSVDKS